MTDVTLAAAQQIIEAGLGHGRSKDMLPLSVVVLDARGALKAAASEDATSLKRSDIAYGKAHGALALGMGSRSIFKRARDQGFFVAAVTHVVGGALIPVPGGVLIKDSGGAVLGAVGVSGDTSENDEAVALAGIAAAGLTADPGAD